MAPAVPRQALAAGSTTTGSPDDAPLLRIGEVARRCGVSTRTLRWYEEMELLRPAATTEGGFRLYDPSVVERVERILRLRDGVHFTLEEIRDTLDADDRVRALWGSAGVDPAERVAAIDAYLVSLDRQQELVLAKRAQLDAVLDELDQKARRAEARRAELLAERESAGSTP
jgi:MerR family transcriptional regulator, repressor of the yfmOP operon